MQTRASYRGSTMQNEAAHHIAEYSQRKRLAALGYTTNISELTALKAEIFGIIDIEIDSCQNAVRSKNGKR